MTIDATQGTQIRSSVLLTPEDIQTQFAGDPNAEIAALMLGHAREVRDGARQARAADEQNIEAQENQQIEDMRRQADDTRSAGTIEGVTEIVGGGFGVLAGTTGNVELFKGTGDMTKGIGTMGAAWYKGESQIDDADSTAASHHAQAAIRRLDDIKDVEKDARDLARNAIDFYRDQVHAQADADHAALFLRG